ncbi:MAG: Protein translocase subunit SecE [Nocardia sp.]|uniref:preprotein translocase subunit SecE n=1 Tax=Nocardia sp. TaxID=1821 RepID=UPI0026053BD8|nr:preprotein translocase subunit SecE [Nocardia sp.]MCU1640694.1 Protein translocase subunit SecE [Nocardia sp.]
MSDERDTRHEDGDDTAAVARPSGKRSARRSRAASSSATNVATIDRPTSQVKADKKKSGKAGGAGNPFKRLTKFLKEVIAELRKVIWPNRKQMVTYTSVVLVFVIFMIAFISGLDLGFIKGVNWLFG